VFSKSRFLASVVVTLIVIVASAPTLADEIHGTPGSPSATVTIEGHQLPPPPQKFEGKIERNASQSTPYWPARVEPPPGAPNVLLIITDDTGYGTPSTFGGVIPTPNLDRVANNGLRYTNFHSTAL
jgi:arylsulfatase